MRLSTRLAVMTGLAVPVMVLLAGMVLFGWMAADLRAARDAELRSWSSALNQVLAVSTVSGQVSEDSVRALVSASGTEDSIQIDTPRGLLRIGELPDVTLPADDGFFTVRQGWRLWRGYSTRTPYGRVWVLQPGTVLASKIVKLIERTLYVAALAVPGAVFGALALGRIATRPLRQLQSRASAVGRWPGQRVALHTRVTEIDEIAQALDTALVNREVQEARTVEALRAARAFAATAAHELRTPLMGMQANLDVLAHPAASATDLTDALGDVRALHQRMLGMLGVLRELSRAELIGPDQFSQVDLAEVAAAAVAAAATRHPRAGIELDAPASVPMRAWPDGLRMVLDNVLDNAAVHGASGTAGTQVRVELAVEDGFATLTVDDDGPGIPPAVRGAVFERFYRTPNSPGRGLGLALVREVVLRHAGRVGVDRAPAGGARIQISLPCMCLSNSG